MDANEASKPQTLVVNLYGGPGTGKSTTAAALFALLKMDGVNAELATEYAKDIVWEGRNYLLSDQIYIFAKQNRKFVRLFGKVDVIVTDSPLLLCYYYSGNEHILALARQEMARARHLHVMLRRMKAYNPNGRTQTEEQAKEVDAQMRAMLVTLGVSFLDVTADREAPQNLLPIVKAELAKQG
jgi:hypothetical protein